MRILLNAKIREVSKKYKNIENIKQELLIDIEPEAIDFNVIPEQYQMEEYKDRRNRDHPKL